KGDFKLRLFGTNSRSTYLNIGGGERSWNFTNPTSSVTNTFFLGQLNIYIFRFFGIEGEYDQYSKGTDNTGTVYSGYKVTYGAFFEFGVLRIGARAINETTYVTPAGSALSAQTRNGTQIEAGLMF